MNFDMDTFLNDFKASIPSEALLMMSMLHHLWESCPLKLSTGLALIALSPSEVIDVSDIRRIFVDADGDYRLCFKSSDTDRSYILAGTPEWMVLQKFITTLPTTIQPEH